MAGLVGKHKESQVLPSSASVLSANGQMQPREDSACTVHYSWEGARTEKDARFAAGNRGSRLPRALGTDGDAGSFASSRGENEWMKPH